MKLRLDLGGELDQYLRADQAAAFEIADGASLAELVQKLPFAGRVALTSVNGTMVPPAERTATVLQPGDEVMMLPPIKGG